MTLHFASIHKRVTSEQVMSVIAWRFLVIILMYLILRTTELPTPSKELNAWLTDLNDPLLEMIR
jgi:hypothetical protein